MSIVAVSYTHLDVYKRQVARLICDVKRPGGEPFEGDPRYVLKRAVREAAELGYTFEVGPECEFFLFHTDENGLPTTITHEDVYKRQE